MLTTILALGGGLLAAKMIMRRRRFAHHGPGGCGGGHFRMFRGHGDSFRARWRDREGAFVPTPSVDAAKRITEAFAALELNTRQREEVNEVFQMVRDELGPAFATWAGVDDALAAIAATEFDRVRAEASLPVAADRRARIADELDHLNVILTSEQRDKLRALLTR